MTDRTLNGMFACYVTVRNLARNDYRVQSATVCIAKN